MYVFYTQYKLIENDFKILFLYGGFWLHIISAQRCWWGCIFENRHIWRRNVMRRYVLGNAQSEDVFIIGMGFRVDIFYTQRCW